MTHPLDRQESQTLVQYDEAKLKAKQALRLKFVAIWNAK